MVCHWFLASRILVNIGLGNVLSPVQSQAIGWIHADLLLETLGTDQFEWNLFIVGKAFENSDCQNLLVSKPKETHSGI